MKERKNPPLLILHSPLLKGVLPVARGGNGSRGEPPSTLVTKDRNLNETPFVMLSHKVLDSHPGSNLHQRMGERNLQNRILSSAPPTATFHPVCMVTLRCAIYIHELHKGGNKRLEGIKHMNMTRLRYENVYCYGERESRQILMH